MQLFIILILIAVFFLAPGLGKLLSKRSHQKDVFEDENMNAWWEKAKKDIENI